MRPAYAASLAAALICHALLLFGFKLETPASPLALSDDPSTVDVSLVASAPDSTPAEQAAPPEAAPTPAATPPPPPPAPTPPPPMVEPTPEMSTPPPEPAQTPAPEIAPATVSETPRGTPKPHPVKHSHKPGQATGAPVLEERAHQGAAGQGPIGTAVRYRSNPKPEYPQEARQLREEGVVLLSVDVSAEGRVTDVSVKTSSGFDLLDQAAMKAVKRWTFEPARVASFPVAKRVDVPIRFSLSE